VIEKTRMIPDGKDAIKKAPILHFKEAKYLYYPITNARCPVGETCVLGGQFVKVGEQIGTRKGAFFEQPIHATASGEIVGIEKHHDQNGKLVDCIILKNDQKYTLHENISDRSDEEIANLKNTDLIQIAKDMGLVGLGGGGFPTYIKLSTTEEIHTIVINGVECEPYLISDYDLMLSNSHQIIKGLVYAMQAMNVKKGVIAIKKKYQSVKEKLEFAITEYPDFDIKVALVGNYYPQGWELETVKSAINVKIPQGELTAKYGVLIFNVATIESLYHAVKHKMPVLERFFSLSGDGIKPTSFRARIGTKISDLVPLAGGYLNEDIPKTLVLGGPMMGANTLSDDVMITHTLTSMIVFNDVEYFEEPCIHCASCVYSCPVKIQPVQIMNALKLGSVEDLEILNVNKCIECGLCSYVCPSKIHLTQYMRDSKSFLRRKGN